jgi:hypothetical protein
MQTCRQCQSSFEITDADRAFYKKVGPKIGNQKFPIPEPTLCPPCREQLRLTWKNERRLYHRTCDLCDKKMISIFSPDLPSGRAGEPFTVYCMECWWSDKWDTMDYGQDYDPSRSFFDQFKNLLLKVPKQALHQNNNAENCEYTTSTTSNRNCYLISSSGFNEDCYYGIFMPRNKNCIDSLHVMNSEKCYECADSDGGYNLFWCQNTKDCNDSKFLYDCHGGRDCFFSYGLRNKQYVFRNEQLSKEEYEKKLAEIDFSSHQTIEALKKEFKTFCQGHARLYYDGQHNENVVASDHVFNSKNASRCFDCNYLEDCKFCGWYNESKDSYDVYSFGYGNELCYNSMEIGTNATNTLMSISCWGNVSDIMYCFAVHASRYLFGCSGLKQKKYCVLNKQYTKEEYEKLVPQIIKQMQSDGEWGEFPPASFSHFAYNETMSVDFYPMEREEVLARNWQWKDDVDEVPNVEKTIPAARLPDNTADIPDDIVNWAIECEASGRPFKILAQELKFYRENNLPIPRRHPDERHKRRLSLRNPRKVHDRQCDKCQAPLQTTYPPNSPEVIYCEECYLSEVY